MRFWMKTKRLIKDIDELNITKSVANSLVNMVQWFE